MELDVLCREASRSRAAKAQYGLAGLRLQALPNRVPFFTLNFIKPHSALLFEINLDLGK